MKQGKRIKKEAHQQPPMDKEQTNRRMLWRILLVMLVLGVLVFIPLGMQLYQVMIVDHDFYEGLAIDNQTRTTTVSASRGTIYDRNMNILATSATVENVFLDPNEIMTKDQDVNLIADGLSEILGVTEEFVKTQAADTKMRYKIISRKLEQAKADEVRAFINENDLSGIYLEPDTQRYYPNGALSAHVLGFVRTDNVGAEGIEAYYDSYLEGTGGKIITAKGNYGSQMLYTYEKYYEASDGDSLVLTMDTTVQYYLQKHMEEAIEQYDVLNGAFGLVMDPNTGEILGMASYNNYDPNNYLEIYEESSAEELQALWLEVQAKLEGTDAREEAQEAYDDALVAARLSQWRNRCISDGYEPGSTFKTITMAAAIEEGVVSLTDTFVCTGSAEIWGRLTPLECWQHYGHGQETLAQTLQNSCNPALAEISIRLGGERFYEYAEMFGLMERTGVDLPGEASGVFFNKSYLTNYESYGYSSLSVGAIGQTFKVTPIQLVRAISAVVNGGYLVEPYVVSQVLDADNNVISETETTVIRQVISEETSAIMRDMMISVVETGTGKNGGVVGYTIGGKTGTSEKIDEFDEFGNPVDDKIVSFVGVAFDEEEKARYVVLIALDTPSTATGLYISGGVMAAPTVGNLMADLLPYLGIEPKYEGEDIRFMNVTMPNCVGMDRNKAANTLKEKSLTYRVVGSGDTVTGQIPAEGGTLPGGSEVILYMGEDVPSGTITVPDFYGLTVEQANARAAYYGLYLQSKGAQESSGTVTVTSQDYAPGTQVARGTTVTVRFTDSSARD